MVGNIFSVRRKVCLKIEICQLRRAKDSLSREMQKAPQLVCYKCWEKEANFQRFYVLKMGRSGFVCYMINNKIEPKEEKNEYKIA